MMSEMKRIESKQIKMLKLASTYLHSFIKLIAKVATRNRRFSNDAEKFTDRLIGW